MQPSLITAALTHSLQRHCVLQSITAENTRQLWWGEKKSVTPEQHTQTQVYVKTQRCTRWNHTHLHSLGLSFSAVSCLKRREQTRMNTWAQNIVSCKDVGNTTTIKRSCPHQCNFHVYCVMDQSIITGLVVVIVSPLLQHPSSSSSAPSLCTNLAMANRKQRAQRFI